MRISIDIYARKIPIVYRHRIMALIKESLKISNSEYKSLLYNTRKGPHKPKPFTFYLRLAPSWRMVNDSFEFGREARCRLFISTSDYEFLIHLYNGLIAIKTFEMERDNPINIGRCTLLQSKEIYDEEVVFKTLSPILIEDKEERPIIPQRHSKNFDTEFCEIHNRILKTIRGSGLKREIEFFPVKIRKAVVKHYISDFERLTGKRYMMLTCFEGIIKLKGDREDLQFLYDNGIGLRTSQGFGMVDIVN